MEHKQSNLRLSLSIFKFEKQVEEEFLQERASLELRVEC
jgi:hypothetical protein